MRLLVGITTSDLTSLKHKSVTFRCSKEMYFTGYPTRNINDEPNGVKLTSIAAGTEVTVTAGPEGLTVKYGTENRAMRDLPLAFEPYTSNQMVNGTFTLDSLKRWGGKGASAPKFVGRLIIFPDISSSSLRLILETDLDSYLKGVLQSEIPPTYEMEAIKAQAVTARTYALRPRIDHRADHCNVCDSYLCCQYFGGLIDINPRYVQAIDATKGEVLTHQDQPILALFSSCAGGHTESYDNCFSDPITGQFPPPPLPYLRGVAEGELPPGFGQGRASEAALRALFSLPHPATCDAWSPQFRWSVHVPAEQMEAHMHHVVEQLLKDPTTSPFITPSQNGKFGQINGFSISKRGVAGTAIVMRIETSTGDWLIQKELVIRSVFKLQELKIARLKSARIFFDEKLDASGYLAAVDIHGFGFGHGVGLQQTGSQGLAKRGLDYRQIVSHYFLGAQIQRK